jgi:hypothetical protein
MYDSGFFGRRSNGEPTKSVEINTDVVTVKSAG